MGLPSKKQLNKHRRGARKALDTLDALTEEELATGDGSGDSGKKMAPKTKSAASRSKKKSKAPVKKKKPAKKPIDKSIEADVNGEEVIPASKETISEAMELVSEEQLENPPPAIEEPAAPMMTDSPEETPDSQQPAAAKIEKKMEIKLDDSGENSPAKPAPKMDGPLPPDSAENKPQGDAEDVSLQFADVEEDTQKDRYLSFKIAKEDYALEIRFITEIIVMQKITEVPNTASFIKGVINLRGKVIPVMDVRERFHLEIRAYDDRTCIVVVNVDEISVGLIVDTVNEVLDIPADRIDPPPSTYSGIESSYISGMGKIGKKVKILLDVKNVLNLTE